mgnify:CR=1 FL=1
MSVKVSSLAATIEMLGAPLSLGSSTAGDVKVKGDCGTIALINQIISDLSSLRTTLRDAEKEMQTNLRASMIRNDDPSAPQGVAGNSFVDLDSAALDPVVKIGQANKEHVTATVQNTHFKTATGTSGGIAAHWVKSGGASANEITDGPDLERERQGANWLGRGEDEDPAGSAINTGKVGIKLGTNDAIVAEQAIMNVLVDVYGVVDKLKNGSSIVIASHYKGVLE